MRALSAIACLLIVWGIGISIGRQSTPTASPRGSAAGSAQPADAQRVRAEIRAVENVLPKVPDRRQFLLHRQYAHNTLSGIDGLYWNKGEFLGVQYGTGAYRVMRWQLSADGRKVTASEILEHRTDLVNDPTTGAVLGDKFYFIANTGIYNLEDDKIVDPAKLEPVHIAVVALK